MYPRFYVKPSENSAVFDPVIQQAIANGQVLLHMFPGEPWRFHLGVYSLRDWPDDTTHQDFYDYFQRVYGINGDWGSFYRFYQSNVLRLDHIDIRMQEPQGTMHFGIIVVQHAYATDSIVQFLQQNLSNEHKGIRPWSSLGIGTKRYLCGKAGKNINNSIRKLDLQTKPLFVLTKHRSKCDLLGGHAKLYELINVVEHFANGDMVQNHLWPSVLEIVNRTAFYREAAEELGLVAHPSGDIGDRRCYYGQKTGPHQFVWIQFVEEEDSPIQVVISA